MSDKTFEENFEDIMNTLENKAKSDKDKGQADILGRYRESFKSDIFELNRIAEKLGYKLDFTLKSDVDKSHYVNIANTLSKDYFIIYYVDLVSDTYKRYSDDSHKFNLKLNIDGMNFFRFMRSFVKRFVHIDDREKVLYMFDKSRILSELSSNETDIFTCRLFYENRSFYVKIKMIRIKNADGDCLVAVVSDVDAQMRSQIEYEHAKKERLTYSRIAQVLSKDYFAIYYIDADTGNYIEYSSHADYKELKIENEGADFFKDCARNIRRVIYKDDIEKLLLTMNTETLVKETENGKIFGISYRLMIGGKPIYVRLKALRLYDKDGHHILIGVKNIDEQRKREQFYADELAIAREQANEDTLTGVKNKRAYNEAEEKLNSEISCGADVEFALVVCDINDLKLVNDKNGHKAGDEFIKDAAKTVCGIFKNTFVYRVGGDEFAVILRGEDYVNRHSLVKKINLRMRKIRGQNVPIIACGMAEYMKGDKRVSDVFDRADDAMYAEKIALKKNLN